MLFDALFDNTVIPLLEQVTAFTGARHRVLLSNIANAATPGYRARDLSEKDFQRLLRDAVEAWRRDPGKGFNLRNDDAFHVAAAPDAGPPGPDGNNVDLERQTVHLIENTLRHNTALELMRKQFALIQTALRERI